MNEWELTDQEWAAAGWALGRPDRPDRSTPQPGRPRLDNTRPAAEACLFHHFASLAPKRHTFGWNSLPRRFGVSPSTANRRYREWLETGAWVRFWDALVANRRGQAGPAPAAGGTRPALPQSLLDSPVRAVVEELERAFRFFNDRFFAAALPAGVVITLEDRPRSARLGYFCGRRWATRHLIVVTTTALAGGKEAVLGTLLHEMVHLRNHAAGLTDCSRSQYHNRHFRDAAILAGLDCLGPTKGHGYGRTRLGDRARAAVEAFQPLNGEAFGGLLQPPGADMTPPAEGSGA